jgi:hypothetical protein
MRRGRARRRGGLGWGVRGDGAVSIISMHTHCKEISIYVFPAKGIYNSLTET